jgi:2-amino-4-hydroxy-6-hydroxymethyldihydropteridine diphosphokinase
VKVYVALGSNLGDREAHLIQGASDIEELESCTALVMSSIYETRPMGPQDQPDYLNSACSFDCQLEPSELLHELKLIERQHGRIQSTERWRARPLDLDILLFGDLQIDSPDLKIPHPGLADRAFVLWPLAELNDSLHIPGCGDLKQLMQSCDELDIRRVG